MGRLEMVFAFQFICITIPLSAAIFPICLCIKITLCKERISAPIGGA
ncbi:hypothetical protein LEP1GSC202_1036 [Leptospira yanagawae serovar Saopaulo str. Sao Paulo = ATCC 700523]|uniref:Uncharacterized protein n=1 Tax=Leptospira yanagawae serovar Saopaulo str. Sao Paulo = ATCC 700523 TaxID=1249483 RepID=A0A5E8HEZ4_9LEPT|nr:hypothetical protein LEP1GSC202_1036 [Leptospira yanagawae serovar Saopaulo str. Sao Paulo = ATCC 700523]